MKYTRQERLDIGKDIYENHLSYRQAAKKYGVSVTAVHNYYLLYLEKAGLNSNKSTGYSDLSYGELEALSKQELIDELIKARVEAERSKKGYTVKGGGQEKEFIVLNKQNSK